MKKWKHLNTQMIDYSIQFVYPLIKLIKLIDKKFLNLYIKN